MKFDIAYSLALLIMMGLALIFWWMKRRRTPKSGLIALPSSNNLPARSSVRLFLYRILPWLRVLTLILLAIALIRPQIGNVYQEISRSGIAIQLLIDRSTSMKEPIIYKNRRMTRLDAVKQVLDAFILGNGQELSGRGNDMVGLTGFARYSEEYAPLTLDHINLSRFVQSISFADPIEDGTMIGDALHNTVLRLIAADTFLSDSSDANQNIKSKIIVLLTDGIQSDEGFSPVEAAEFARKNNIKIYVIAIIDNNVRSLLGTFLNQSNTEIHLAKKITETTGGRFALVNSGEELLDFYAVIDQLEKSEVKEEILTWNDYYFFFLLAGFVLLSIEMLLDRLYVRKI